MMVVGVDHFKDKELLVVGSAIRNRNKKREIERYKRSSSF